MKSADLSLVIQSQRLGLPEMKIRTNTLQPKQSTRTAVIKFVHKKDWDFGAAAANTRGSGDADAGADRVESRHDAALMLAEQATADLDPVRVCGCVCACACACVCACECVHARTHARVYVCVCACGERERERE